MMIVIDLVEGTVERREARRPPEAPRRRETETPEPRLHLPQTGSPPPVSGPSLPPPGGEELERLLERMERR